jgi:hypothetical protein
MECPHFASAHKPHGGHFANKTNRPRQWTFHCPFFWVLCLIVGVCWFSFSQEHQDRHDLARQRRTRVAGAVRKPDIVRAGQDHIRHHGAEARNRCLSLITNIFIITQQQTNTTIQQTQNKTTSTNK